jgi:hypothetical protein
VGVEAGMGRGAEAEQGAAMKPRPHQIDPGCRELGCHLQRGLCCRAPDLYMQSRGNRCIHMHCVTRPAHLEDVMFCMQVSEAS